MSDTSDPEKLVKTKAPLPSSVRVERGAGGLPRLAVQSRLATAQVYFQGAHITAWQPTSADAPVLWVSRESWYEPGRPIRGGVPICFPWFGSHATDPKAPGHGFARVRDWTLIDARDEADGAVTLVLELASSEPPASVEPLSPLWPHAFAITHRITIGSSLGMALQVTNRGADRVTFEEALHTYFAVQDVRSVTVTGLAGTDYLDKVTNFSRKSQGPDPVQFTGETDRIYLNTQAACTLHDPGKRRRITIAKTGSNATVVWNPWIDKAKAMPDYGDLEWPEMVCVETGNVNVHARTLGAGESHTMTASIDVAPL